MFTDGVGVGFTGQVGFLVLIGAQFGSGAFVGLGVGRRVGFLEGGHRLWKSAGLWPSSLYFSEW